MLLIVAALHEELATALELCSGLERIRGAPRRAWSGRHGSSILYLSKLGIGPRRSSSALRHLLTDHRPDRILLIGYAGALDPGLEVGDLVVVKEAVLLGHPAAGDFSLAGMSARQACALAESPPLMDAGLRAGLPVHSGIAVTAPGIVGKPSDKRLLRERFGANVVDMETAALALACESASIAFQCIRAISDTAEDEFLAPFSFDPAVTPLERARRVWAAGNWLGNYREWRERASKARSALKSMLASCLDGWAGTD